jgi:hypothetical protein
MLVDEDDGDVRSVRVFLEGRFHQANIRVYKPTNTWSLTQKDPTEEKTMST